MLNPSEAVAPVVEFVICKLLSPLASCKCTCLAGLLVPTPKFPSPRTANMVVALVFSTKTAKSDEFVPARTRAPKAWPVVVLELKRAV